jgi:hypothetical protein
MSKLLQYLVIHCTATPEGRKVTSDDIRRWHLSPVPEGRGWKQVGYTDMIHLDGTIERLVKNNDDAYVDAWEITNGVENMNSVCRHIVYVGGLMRDGRTAKDTRTPEQLVALTAFVKKFHAKFPTVQIVGHNHFAQKACPSFDVATWLTSIGI